MTTERILISGGGIAGLTLGILLRERGFDPLVIEREPALRTEGYIMDFFGTGWDVAGRMGLLDDVRAISYPIERLEFVDAQGRAFASASIDDIARALDGRYAYLRRSDLEEILFARARARGLEVRFGASIRALEDRGDRVAVEFDNGGSDSFALVVGADGVYSRVRELVFGPHEAFQRFIGLNVAAFRIGGYRDETGRALKLYEETDRAIWMYPIAEDRVSSLYLWRTPEPARAPAEERLAFLRREFRDTGWIARDVLRDVPESEPIYLDAALQIVMPSWCSGRVALIGDACGCLTLVAGQGSHMAMGGAYVLAQELARHPDDHAAAFAAYEGFMHPVIDRKQKAAADTARWLIPSEKSIPFLRRTVIRAIFGTPLRRYFFKYFGAESDLAERKGQRVVIPGPREAPSPE